ncbi:MAG: hypothetical protein JSW20_06965 [Nitrospiraceae bacterium]|nr:MAG: hypothetical protein JSW20_06965 [Nitrospiraceae bacterium]
MSSNVNKVISSAITRLLRPLVSILLNNGIPYGTFCELAKWVYVDTASKELAIPGRKQTTSRIAVVTGLSRKEVKRLRELSEIDDLGAADRYNRAIRVINGWRRDSNFIDGRGLPKALYFEGDLSFSSLVKKYSGDIPPRAVLDEMLRSGVVKQDNDRIRLLTEGYILQKGEAEKLHIFGLDSSEFIATVRHNLTSSPSNSFLQRKVSYDNIPDGAIPELRNMLSEKGAVFLESLDRIISKYDRDVNPSIRGEGRKKAGLGIFYFEE